MRAKRNLKLISLVTAITVCAALLLSLAVPTHLCAWGEKKLTVVSVPDNGGTITYDPPLCAAGTYARNTEVTLTAVPSEGCGFEKWSGDIGDNEAGNISITVVMDEARTITADFTNCPGPLNITLSYNIYSIGGDTINASFGSITWSTDRTTSVTTVNITASAARGYRFDRWQGAINSSQKTASFIINSSDPITAQFSKTTPLLWLWTSVGIAIALLVAILMYRFTHRSNNGQQEVYIDAAGPSLQGEQTP